MSFLDTQWTSVGEDAIPSKTLQLLIQAEFDKLYYSSVSKEKWPIPPKTNPSTTVELVSEVAVEGHSKRSDERTLKKQKTSPPEEIENDEESWVGAEIKRTKGTDSSRVYYGAVRIGKEELHVGTCIQLYAEEGEPPFIAKINELWEEKMEETSKRKRSKYSQSNKMVTCQWFYRKEDVEGENELRGRRSVFPDINNKSGHETVYLSSVMDHNPLNAIKGKCIVVGLNNEESSEDVPHYFFGGTFDTATGEIMSINTTSRKRDKKTTSSLHDIEPHATPSEFEAKDFGTQENRLLKRKQKLFADDWFSSKKSNVTSPEHKETKRKKRIWLDEDSEKQNSREEVEEEVWKTSQRNPYPNPEHSESEEESPIIPTPPTWGRN